MVKFSGLSLIFGIATGCINLLDARAEPGCLQAVQGKAISEKAARLLPPHCQEFRKSYLKGLQLLSKDPKKLSQELTRQIQAKKSFEPPYDALLISTFPKQVSDDVKKAITARAQIETKQKFKYQYAVATLEKMEKGSCSPRFSEYAYDEICKGKDLAYERIEKLQAVKGAAR